MADINPDTPVRFLRGVGPSRARVFELLGIRTVGELIEHYPHRYETIPRSVPISELEADRNGTVVGTVTRVRPLRARGGSGIAADVVDGTGRCRVHWFNAAYLADRIVPGRTIRVSGRVGVYRDLARFTNPRFELFDDDQDPLSDDVDRFEPVYPARAELSSGTIARIIADALPKVIEHLHELLPNELLRKRRLPPRRTAVMRIHRPVRAVDAETARRRLAYDELLILQLALRVARTSRTRVNAAPVIDVTPRVDERIRRLFPFALTAGQNEAVQRIAADLNSSRPMNRLLQGDVGSGKTAVAMYAALAVVAGGRQALIAAPTEILAEQHFSNARALLADSKVRVELLVGHLSSARRRAVLEGAASGGVDLLVGTHALLEEDVRFADLGLAVVDEQHKFGVAQRARLRTEAGSAEAQPHCLVMTATPIPRTLAMTFFGDADITTIRDAPPGRRPVKTQMVRRNRVGAMWRFVRERLEAGEQAYVVYPLVEESENLPLTDAVSAYESLRKGPLRGVNVGLIHGRLGSDEKKAAMKSFAAGETAVLVSTTVVEVGVDVGNATVMVIQHAERFGLSQLHQLRGRVGRGNLASHCLLVSDAEHGPGADRLRALCETTDGFKIAEADLAMRGPGELLGTRQHGLPELRVVRLNDDADLMPVARDDAADILAGDPGLTRPEHSALRRELRRRYGAAFRFADVA